MLTRVVKALFGVLCLLCSNQAWAVCLSPPGDIDATGKANVADVQCLIIMNLWSLGGQVDPVPQCVKVPGSPAIIADHNCDGVINVADTLLAINFALNVLLDGSIDANTNQCVDACEVDSDGDGDFDLLDCAPLNPLIGNNAAEVCNGYDDDCNTVVDDAGLGSTQASCSDGSVCTGVETCEGLPNNLGVVITELMVDPGNVADNLGEWIEIYNGGSSQVNINGWTLTDGAGQTHLIAPGGALFVPPAGYIVLAINGNKTTNGGVRVNYPYTGFVLDNALGTVTLLDELGALVDTVAYGGATGISVPSGKSIALIRPDLDNTTAASWAQSTAAYGLGDKGTPAGANFDVMPSFCEDSADLFCDDGNPCTDDSCDPISGCDFTNNTLPCDDGNQCTVNDACALGTCSDTDPLNCDDGDVCTDDACDPGVGCVNNQNTALCNDGDACTVNDSCALGVCVGGPPPICDDNNLCTGDSCNSAVGCVYTPNNLPCDDENPCTTFDACAGGVCVGGGPSDCDDGNICTDDSCDPTTGCFTIYNNGGCNDNDPCTTADACAIGVCVGSGTLNCDDSNPCTTDGCTSGVGCFHTNNAEPCNDNNFCTDVDVCSGGACGGAPISCDDGNECTVDGCLPATGCSQTPVVCDDNSVCTIDSCDPGVGCVFTPSAANCDDSDPCTDDVCDPVVGCINPLNTASCDDGNICTTNDACSSGVCVGGPPLVCNDNNGCTADSCVVGVGCQSAPQPGACDDGNICTVGDFCDAGACEPGGPLDCDDDNVCTDDTCNPAVGCEYTFNTVPCDDNDACTDNTACDEGLCEGVAVLCNDGDLCTDDTCDVVLGCQFPATNCNDNNACNIDDCEPTTGCTHEPLAQPCDDNNVCTDDSCNPALGCVFSPNSASCDDNNVCTSVDVCSNGACVGTTPVNCNDSNVCSSDTCHPVTGCQYAPVTGSCSDGNACTTNDTCIAMVCTGGPPPVCNDNNGCTDDGCDSVAGCVFVANTAPCSDNNACTENDICTNKSCAGTTVNCNDDNACTADGCNTTTGCTHGAINCNDGNVCTDDGCDPDTGCINAPNISVCNDNNACTENDICGSGTCAGSPKNCNDGIACTVDGCNVSTGCTNVKQNSLCNDNIACTIDTCEPILVGGCKFTPNNTPCNDFVFCTADICDPAIGCTHPSNFGPCDDGNVCTVGDECVDGECVPGPDLCLVEQLTGNQFCQVSGEPNDIVACPVRVARKTVTGPFVGGVLFTVPTKTADPVEIVSVSAEVCNPGCTTKVMPDTLDTGHQVAVYPTAYDTWATNNSGSVLVYGGPASLSDAYINALGGVIGDAEVVVVNVRLKQSIAPSDPVKLTLENVSTTSLLGVDMQTQIIGGTIVADLPCPVALQDADNDGQVDTCPACIGGICDDLNDVFCFVSGLTDDVVECPIEILRKSLTSPPVGGVQFRVELDDATAMDVETVTSEVCLDPGTCFDVDMPGLLETGHTVDVYPSNYGSWAPQLGGDLLAYGGTDQSLTNAYLDSDNNPVGDTEIFVVKLRLNQDIPAADPKKVRISGPAASSLLGQDLEAVMNNGRIVVGSPSDAVFCSVFGPAGSTWSCPIHLVRETVETPMVAGIQFTVPFYDPASVDVLSLTAFHCDEDGQCSDIIMPETLDTGHQVAISPPLYENWVLAGSATVLAYGGDNLPLNTAFLTTGGAVIGASQLFSLQGTLLADVPADAPLTFHFTGTSATTAQGVDLQLKVLENVLIAAVPPVDEICWLSGLKGDTVQCHLRLVRLSSSVAKVAGLEVDLTVDDISAVTYTNLTAEVCASPGNCSTVVMPQPLETGHTVAIYPQTYNGWTNLGGGSVLVFGSATDGITDSYYSTAGTLVGNPVFMTLTVQLNKSISSANPMPVRAIAKSASDLFGMDLIPVIQDGMIVIY
ncbi:MAG: lamin tail domain-containing protein [Myxococcales bacterium]|nr:lamin tail domain-containing protein [Myxococcales bacterium]